MKTQLSKPARSKARYTDQYKREALELWRASGRSAAKVAAELGIRPPLLYRWGRWLHRLVRPHLLRFRVSVMPLSVWNTSFSRSTQIILSCSTALTGATSDTSVFGMVSIKASAARPNVIYCIY
jgi:hypothetical protein